MTHPPTTLFAPRTIRAERRLWTVLAALFVLVAGVNSILALSEAEWWQGAVAALFALAAAGCAWVARRSRG
ncbi:hypothetical protein [Saccharothrix algeriensis]|uniref:Fatty acid desaturase n=1 Tax=Saccharothrix algeriensis TaxID=173560 RepID=A0A8T8HXW1_9PSEU|nr:hypothetical protein [Saccharothrix algeriensis]MBM7814229.1 fatty acid desaturase [Saccharothrix algeriensis]QTR02584.1 hypothetical protein J7S33_26390 [Saccharothrix algeriensis]